jgi:DNA-binding LytR/AlgR family response regulator
MQVSLRAMPEVQAAATAAGFIARTLRRAAVALTIAMAVALLLLNLWRRTPQSALFLRLTILALSGTTAFVLFEVWPPRLPRWINTEQLLQQLSAPLAKLHDGGRQPLRWVRAQAGKTVRLIAVEDVDYFRSDAKYTLDAWRDGGKPAEAVVRTPLKELLEQLDPEQFAQVHRSVVVNLRAIGHVKRHDNETAEIHLKARSDVLPVSRHYVHLFRQM